MQPDARACYFAKAATSPTSPSSTNLTTAMERTYASGSSEQQPRVLVLAAVLGQLQHRRHLVVVHLVVDVEVALASAALDAGVHP